MQRGAFRTPAKGAAKGVATGAAKGAMTTVGPALSRNSPPLLAALLSVFAAGAALIPAPAPAQTPSMAIVQRAGGTLGCDPGERQIRFSHVVVEKGHPKGEAAAALAAAINEKLDGAACMIVYPDSTLFDDNEVMEAMLRGEVEMAAPSLSKFESYTKIFRVFDLPFLFRDADAVEWFQNSGPGSRIRRSLTPLGFRALAFWNAGMKQMSARRPIQRPDDIRGVTFRIQDSDVIRAQFQMVGAKVVPMAFKDVAKALETGKVEGQENSWSNIQSKEFYRWQDGVTETNHAVLAYAVVTSEAFWKDLPQETRVALSTIVAQVSAEANLKARQLDELAKATLVEQGVTIRKLSAEDRAAWVEAMEPVWRQFEDDIGKSFIDAAVSANR